MTYDETLYSISVIDTKTSLPPFLIFYLHNCILYDFVFIPFYYIFLKRMIRLPTTLGSDNDIEVTVSPYFLRKQFIKKKKEI